MANNVKVLRVIQIKLLKVYSSLLSQIKENRKPKWLKVKLPTGEAYKKVRGITKSRSLHTICESGNCPNMGECWGAGTATFMI